MWCILSSFIYDIMVEYFLDTHTQCYKIYLWCIIAYNTQVAVSDLHWLMILLCTGHIVQTSWWRDRGEIQIIPWGQSAWKWEIRIEQVEWWSKIWKMSSQGSFTQLSCLYSFTLPLDSYTETLYPINPCFFTFISDTPRFCPAFYHSFSFPLSQSSVLGDLSHPFPHWFFIVQWVEHSTSNGEGMRSIPTKFQTFSV